MDFLLGDITLILARWVHFLAGVIWIGLLYYFNFVQAPFFAEIDGSVKNVAITKLVPKALLWFRFGALWTFLSGLFYLMAYGHANGVAIFSTSWGVNILIGALLGTTMFANVWLLIWPNQKVVIQSATQVVSGGQPLPNAAACAAKATLASRHNVLFSIPMLLFMGMAKHFGYNVGPDRRMILWIVVLVLIGALEVNAIKGKLGPMTSIQGVILSGFALAAILFVVVRVLA